MVAQDFQFITVQSPLDAKDRVARRLAKSHALKQALKNKRRLQEEAKSNFRVSRPEDLQRSRTNEDLRTEVAVSPLAALSVGALDPFGTLPVDSSRLQTLLENYKARQAPEPVFSVAEELAFQNFHAVFKTSLTDSALLNALMLCLAFAVSEGSIDRECLEYQGQAISSIREKLGSIDDAMSESTLGAILLLAGVEARQGKTTQVQIHMGAVKLLLETSRLKSVHLTSGIKRAIFWQDLNSSVLAGSNRIVDHTTFAELLWARDKFSPNFFRLPPGFQKRRHILSTEFAEVLEDIHALQCIRDVPNAPKRDVTLMAYINNHTASIQSRLANLPQLLPILECCRLAVYLCSVMLCCKVWCELVISVRRIFISSQIALFPSHMRSWYKTPTDRRLISPFSSILSALTDAMQTHISTQLLLRIELIKDKETWEKHHDLMIWLLYIGGAFAPTGPVRVKFVEVLRCNYNLRFGNSHRSWSQLVEVMEQFIWPKRAFTLQVKALWSEVVT